MNDVVINKVQSIQRCVRRAHEEHTLAGEHFATDFSRQDAAILNITRACEQAIDLANVVIKVHKLGIPNQSRESFSLLASAKLIPEDLSHKLQRMVGFRNVVIHEYQQVEVNIIEAVIVSELNNLLLFTDVVVQHFKPKEG
ncbi:MAG: DUF86 domain-containing protein [Mariprofundaceae bacterium]|nr:DUF86 domain-containing protein [Mariprofundaceae bacterium]